MQYHTKFNVLREILFVLSTGFFHQPISIQGNVYFASDFHFGVAGATSSAEREKAVVRWLDRISADADHLFLLGDIFDFWFEYRDVVPKGYLHFLHKLLEMREKGIQIYYFTGNHDMWVKNYFEQELGVRVFRCQQPFLINGKRCVIGHGDGLDPDDKGYLFIKKLFSSKLCIFLYGALPPHWAFSVADFCSRKSRKSGAKKHPAVPQEERMLHTIRAFLQHETADYFIYGHRHLPLQIAVNENVTYFNTGDWLFHSSYVVWKADGPRLCGQGE